MYINVFTDQVNNDPMATGCCGSAVQPHNILSQPPHPHPRPPGCPTNHPTNTFTRIIIKLYHCVRNSDRQVWGRCPGLNQLLSHMVVYGEFAHVFDIIYFQSPHNNNKKTECRPPEYCGNKWQRQQKDYTHTHTHITVGSRPTRLRQLFDHVYCMF